MVVGLTGGIASGKSEVSAILKSLGAQIVDADHISRDVVKPGTSGNEALHLVFGDEIFSPDGSINRRTLGDIVFSDPTALEMLNQMLHPLILDCISEQIKAHKSVNSDALIVLEAPLLIETGLHTSTDEVWVVTAPLSLRLQRLMERDHLSESEAKKRIDTQTCDEYKLRHATRVIHNIGSLEALHDQTMAFYQAIKEFHG